METIPGGWNSQKDTNDTKHDPRPVKGVMERTEMMPVGWNSKKKARNMALLKTCYKKNICFLMEEKVRGRPAITNMILMP